MEVCKMSVKSECLSYLVSAKAELTHNFTQSEQLTDSLFAVFSDFVTGDYEGISENKIYRSFLNTLTEIIEIAFENRASKSFLRSFFKALNNQNIINYLSELAPTHTSDFKISLERLVSEFVYWQESDHKKELKLNYLISIIDSLM